MIFLEIRKSFVCVSFYSVFYLLWSVVIIHRYIVCVYVCAEVQKSMGFRTSFKLHLEPT